ncbi:hypothetical protein WICMUC_002960 [Wickerhamomyces mucosus]|uniref:SPX domain-containing protein n=1 Tax=Wickerhamomyces mucosus TaxID=1378264 RepID=A0A9P8PNX5_9ASCO|nr:hypothetical protein WICMUC_002960 [Wickerhamomyces mucosus]
MLFGELLEQNSFEEWKNDYLHYDQLKSTVFDLKNSNNSDQSSLVSNGKPVLSDDLEIKHGGERSTLKTFYSKIFSNSSKSVYANDDIELTNLDLSGFSNQPQIRVILSQIISEVKRLDTFYQAKETEVFYRINTLVHKLNDLYGINDPQFNDELQHETLKKNHHDSEVGSSSDQNISLKKDSTELDEKLSVTESLNSEVDEEANVGFGSTDHLNSFHNHDYDTDDEVDNTVDEELIQELKDTYMIGLNLKEFIALNKLGLTKFLKKTDKVLNLGGFLKSNATEELLNFEDTKIFKNFTITKLEIYLNRLTRLYGLIKNFNINHNSIACVELEKAQIDSLNEELLTYTRHQNYIKRYNKANVEDLYRITYEKFAFKGHVFKIPSLFFEKNNWYIFFIVIITIILTYVKTLNDRVQGRALAYSWFMCACWATGVIPLFTTSLMAPLLGVLLNVAKNSDGSLMSRSSTATLAFSQMWSSTIMILVSGFALAAALKKYNIAKYVASAILSKFGKSPTLVILINMFISCYLSMFISNVATPVLCFGLTEDLLGSLGSHSKLAQAIALAIAFSSNVGGMASPISSPQNIVAMQYLSPYGINWGTWLGVSIPVTLLANILIWGFLLLVFKFKGEKIKQQKMVEVKFTAVEYFIILVLIATIILWCVSSQVTYVFGSSGVIAIIPIGLFFGLGILNKDDFKHFQWDVVALAMGSITFGKLISASGLLSTVATALQKKIGDWNEYAIVIIFGLLMFVIGTFVSHTVSAIVLLPLVQEVGEKLDGEHAVEVLVFQMALLASCGMGLPSSGFPNVTAISQLDRKKIPFLTNKLFIANGVPSGLIAYAIVVTVGYGIMKAIAK